MSRGEPGEVFVLLGDAYQYNITDSQVVLCSGDSHVLPLCGMWFDVADTRKLALKDGSY